MARAVDFVRIPLKLNAHYGESERSFREFSNTPSERSDDQVLVGGYLLG